MRLVIAEKPSVARNIAAVIGATDRQDGYLQGGGYIVTWCVGHLAGLADAATYDPSFAKWRYEDLPIIPESWRLTVAPDKRERFDTLRTLLRSEEVSEVVNACDAGREGELIFRTVYHLAGCTKPIKRLWISSMEDSAIREGFANLKPGRDYDPLHQSALCRAKADWLIGINATRLFSVLYHKTLTVGRVQTPTLKMLVDRDAKISGFQKEKYHIVHIAGGGVEAASDRFPDPAEAEGIKTACEGAQAVCASVVREKKTEQPPKLYDLTTLQREANRIFGFTAKQTLDYAQMLYEKRLLDTALLADTNGVGLDASAEDVRVVLYAGAEHVDRHRADYALSMLRPSANSIPEIIGTNTPEQKARKEITCELLFFELAAVGFLGIAAVLFKEKSMGVIRVHAILPLRKNLFLLSKLAVFLLSDLAFAVFLTLLNVGLFDGAVLLPAVLLHTTILSLMMALVGLLCALLLKDFRQFTAIPMCA